MTEETTTTVEGAPSTGASPAADQEAVAAIAETNGKAPTIEFRGMTLNLPVKLPGSLALQFTNDPEEQPAMVRGFLKAALGDIQMADLGRKLDTEEIPFDEVYEVLSEEVLQPLFNSYNLDSGKSPASTES